EPVVDVLVGDGNRVTRGDLRDAEVSEPGAAAEIDVVRGGRIAARCDVRAAAVGEVVTHDVPGHAIDADLIPVIALIVGKRAIEYGDGRPFGDRGDDVAAIGRTRADTHVVSLGVGHDGLPADGQVGVSQRRYGTQQRRQAE